jgi:hypothetical protein
MERVRAAFQALETSVQETATDAVVRKALANFERALEFAEEVDAAAVEDMACQLFNRTIGHNHTALSAKSKQS